MALTFGDILIAQLTDPFRIGLMVMLVITSVRTARTVGTAIPLALGIVFVAVIIPTALSSDIGSKETLIGVGLASNAIILVVILAAKFLAVRLLASRRQ